MKVVFFLFSIFVFFGASFSQPAAPQPDDRADAIIQKAVQFLGGDKYRNVSSQIGRGNFSLLKEGVNVSVQSFVDFIVFPDKERAEFKAAGVKTVQTNTGASG